MVCGELYRLNVFDAQGAFVHGFFMTASVMTDNGLATSGYAKWPEHVVIFLMASSFFRRLYWFDLRWYQGITTVDSL
ncbi:hypothetical protein [Dickeya oryzae]